MARLLDVLFFIYFLTHIPIAILIDFQAIIPAKYYPKQLVDLRWWYCESFRDVLFAQTPVWFQSFIYCELFLQLPFFFVGTYGYFKGANKCKWLRIPVLIYGSHVATTVIPTLAHILFHEFTAEEKGPRNMEERLTSMGIYMPYFIFPLAMILDAAFSSVYRAGVTSRQTRPSQNVKVNNTKNVKVSTQNVKDNTQNVKANTNSKPAKSKKTKAN